MARIALAASILILAGCLQAPGPSQTRPLDLPAAEEPLILGPTGTFNGTEGLRFNGSGNARLDFGIQLPPGYWENHTGSVEISIRWHFTAYADYSFRLENVIGRTIGESRDNSYASILLVRELSEGDYRVVVHFQGSNPPTPFEGIIQFESRAKEAPAREILPNLAALAPAELAIEWFLEGSLPGPSLPGRACWPTEIAEKRHLRCLRVSSAVGNAGEGPLQIHMSPLEGAKAAAGLGRYTQRIFKTDGSYREEPVGLGQFHPTHAHFHYNGLAQFTVYKYDLEKDQRGDRVSQSRKNGFCLLDMGLIRLGVPGTTYSDYVDSACLYPDQQGGWIVGLSPSWYDLYGADLDDQSVDLWGVPDGTYELVYTVNADKTLKESNPDDNEASTVFKLRGDKVEIVKRIEDGKHLPPP